MDNFSLFLSFIIYFGFLFGVAIISKIKTKESSDLILGDRSLNFWVTAISAHASDMSSWLFLAFPVSLYIGGVSQCWIAIALVTGMFLNWHFVAPRLRTTTEALDASTISSFFAKRFPEKSSQIRTVTAISAFIFLTYYISAGMIGIGLVLETLFGIDYILGLLFATCIMIGYTFIGGFVSVAWADLFQGLFLLGVIVFVPVVALLKIGGLAVLTLKMAESNLNFNLFGDTVSWKEIIYPFFAWGLGYFGMPHIVTKFMAIKNPKELVKSKYIGISWQIISLGASAFCGIVAVAFFQEPLANPETLFIEMSRALFSPLVLGFAMCGIVAATVSTMDSQILTASSMFSEDILQRLFSRSTVATKKTLFRISVIGISAISFIMASSKNATIMDTVYYAWAGLGSSFGPLMLFSLYSKRVTAKGAFWGIITGFVVSALWPTINTLLVTNGIMSPLPSMIPGFFSSLIVIWVLSLKK